MVIDDLGSCGNSEVSSDGFDKVALGVYAVVNVRSRLRIADLPMR